MNERNLWEGAATPGSNSRTEKQPESNPIGVHLTPPARHDAPATAHEAACRIAGHSDTMRARVLSYIAAQGEAGATDAEIQAALHMLTQSETPRRRELVQLGQVIASGKYRTTPSRRRAVVWALAEHAPTPEGGAT